MVIQRFHILEHSNDEANLQSPYLVFLEYDFWDCSVFNIQVLVDFNK